MCIRDRFYDPNKPLYLESDASKLGLGSAMLQPDYDIPNTSKTDVPNNLRPVAYASKSQRLNRIMRILKENCWEWYSPLKHLNISLMVENVQ